MAAMNEQGAAEPDGERPAPKDMGSPRDEASTGLLSDPPGARISSPLVATFTRGAAFTGLWALVLVGALQATHSIAHWMPTPSLLAIGGPLTFAAGALLVWAILRAEESRLGRELRTARTGSALLRSLVVRRRSALPLLGRLFSTPLGLAAVLLADGDRSGAISALASGSPLMQGGRLDPLRRVVEADVDRAAGTAAGGLRSVETLTTMTPIGHREADLYRVHVLVKSILERGDFDVGSRLAGGLATSPDEEERVYAIWLRVWFDLDSDENESHDWPPLAAGEARLAMLVARVHGASRLVDKLEERLLAIAEIERQG